MIRSLQFLNLCSIKFQNLLGASRSDLIPVQSVGATENPGVILPLPEHLHRHVLNQHVVGPLRAAHVSRFHRVAESAVVKGDR